MRRREALIQTFDAIIVGGGVNGSSVAFELSKRGKKVLLLEKDRIASKASSAAAGMLAAQAELDDDGPLFQLAKKSRGMFPRVADEIKELTSIDIELINAGMYKIALTEQDEDQFKKVIKVHQAAGEQAEWLSGEKVRRKEPVLSDEILGAMFVPNDGQVSAPQLTKGYVKAAVALGTELKEYIDVQSFIVRNDKVAGVVTNEGEFYSDSVIVAGGAWSGRLLQETGLTLSTYPVKGECFSVLTKRPLLTGTIFSHGCYLVPKKGGRLIVGATVKPHTFNQTVTVDGISTLMCKAQKLVPEISGAEWEKAWAGIRPQTGDGLPYLGEHPAYQGLFIATGHFRNGILLSAITGEVVSDLVERKQPAVDVTPFHINRTTEVLV